MLACGLTALPPLGCPLHSRGWPDCLIHQVFISTPSKLPRDDNKVLVAVDGPISPPGTICAALSSRRAMSTRQ